VLLAVAALLVAVMCAGVAVAQGPASAISRSAACQMVDPNVVNGCFKSFGQGMKFTTNPRGRVDCCVVFQGHSCLCEMKKAWGSQGAQNNVQCVRDRVC
jgi:hypothetical protein